MLAVFVVHAKEGIEKKKKPIARSFIKNHPILMLFFLCSGHLLMGHVPQVHFFSARLQCPATERDVAEVMAPLLFALNLNAEEADSAAPAPGAPVLAGAHIATVTLAGAVYSIASDLTGNALACVAMRPSAGEVLGHSLASQIAMRFAADHARQLAEGARISARAGTRFVSTSLREVYRRVADTSGSEFVAVVCDTVFGLRRDAPSQHPKQQHQQPLWVFAVASGQLLRALFRPSADYSSIKKGKGQGGGSKQPARERIVLDLERLLTRPHVLHFGAGNDAHPLGLRRDNPALPSASASSSFSPSAAAAPANRGARTGANADVGKKSSSLATALRSITLSLDTIGNSFRDQDEEDLPIVSHTLDLGCATVMSWLLPSAVIVACFGDQLPTMSHLNPKVLRGARNLALALELLENSRPE